jgi:hypothetical protein
MKLGSTVNKRRQDLEWLLDLVGSISNRLSSVRHTTHRARDTEVDFWLAFLHNYDVYASYLSLPPFTTLEAKNVFESFLG